MSGKRQFGTVRKLPSDRWQARYRDGSGQMHLSAHLSAHRKARWPNRSFHREFITARTAEALVDCARDERVGQPWREGRRDWAE